MATIQGIYIALFGRPADPLGLQYFNQVTNNGANLTAIGDLAATAEYQSRFEGLSNVQIINSIYQSLFGRDADLAGLTFFANALANGTFNINNIAIAILDGAQGDDLAIVNNKIEAANLFTASLDTGAEVVAYQGDAAADAGRAFLAGITADDASIPTQAQVDAAIAAIVGGGGVPGGTFTLTTAVDNVVGTANNDTFIGTVDANTLSGTFNTGDSINGGAGTDTLKLIIANGNGATYTPAQMTGVEVIQVQDLDGNATINLANATGVQTIAANGSTEETQFINVNNMVDVQLTNVNGGGLDINFANAVTSGDNTALNVSVDSSSAVLDIDGVETVNLTVTGSVSNYETNIIDIDSSIVTLNISGDGNLAVVDLRNSLATVDASAATGDIYLDLDNTNDVTITGGSGDDVFDFFGGYYYYGDSFNGNDVVNGGEGFDTVIVAGDNYNAAVDAAPFNSLVSVERVEFQGYGATINGSTFTNSDVTNIRFNTNYTYGLLDDDDEIRNAGSARTYEFGTQNSGNALFIMSGAATVLNLALTGSMGLASEAEDGSRANVGDVTVELSPTAAANAVSTINLSSTGDLDSTGSLYNGLQDLNTVGEINARAGSTINVTGDANLDIDGLANRGTINASAFTGNLIVEGSEFTAFDDNGTPGDPLDDIAFVSGADVISLGSGQSIVQFSSGLDSGVANTTDGPSNTIIVDVINGFKAGANGDILDFTGTAGDADYTALSASAQASILELFGPAATLREAANIASNALNTADEWTAFKFGGETYALYTATAGGAFDDAADVLVQITGVAIADLTDANFA